MLYVLKAIGVIRSFFRTQEICYTLLIYVRKSPVCCRGSSIDILMRLLGGSLAQETGAANSAGSERQRCQWRWRRKDGADAVQETGAGAGNWL